MTAAVTVADLRKSYGHKKGRKSTPDPPPVLAGVSFEAQAGRITTILGESGCGKTTLLRVVAGLEVPSSGRVYIDDRDITSTAPSKRGVAMVFQNYGLYPAKTVAKNIEFPMQMAKVPAEERRARTQAVAQSLHIDHLLDRMPAQLSGGQRQRVGICRALVRDPHILLMDEPLSNLDSRLRIEMRTELVALQRRIGATMLYVTHDQVEAMSMSDLIVVMRHGKIEQMGSPSEVFARPTTMYVAAFLGNMNLVDGAAAGLAPATRETTIGVRPEHFALAAAESERPGDLVVEGRLRFDELHGADRVVHVETPHATWRARLDAAAPLSDTVRLVARRENVHGFDTATGERRAA
ncbi:ABC transporter ATP-binding protein [Rhodococcus sp. ABRD24]|uniref:ABC transporter ATP-binding protein n=1 Tax=Rhodococcus sp. ABRD24 TaxID=2507582 RepID=UPI00103F70F5|nr:ABC transporter ATP-binding protein [Rhodococcus sp. ABRD24]QBJ96995.1 ABC transporter ATP-binding protein [Rhodococcus sp. ABRD24]